MKTDKLLHGLVGFAFGLLYAYIGFWSLILGSIVFFNKEIYDKYKPNPTGFDWWDIAADYTGLLIGLLITLIVKII